MTIKNLVDKIEKLQKNLSKDGKVYISPSNMDYFAKQLAETDAMQGILITPYLIVNDGRLYELHYYEFDVEVRGAMVRYMDYNPNNMLPKEITESLKPQIAIAIGDKIAYSNAVKEYLKNMSNMEFKEDKEYNPELKNAQLFYQIFMDMDLD